MENVRIITNLHNNPPSQQEAIFQSMGEKHDAIRKATHDLCAKANTAPDAIENEDQAALITDLIKEITKQDKAVDTTRVAEKEFYLAGGRAVDAYFNRGREMLSVAKNLLAPRLNKWLTDKANKERARREEEERAAKEAADKAAADALALEQSGNKAEASVQLQHAVTAETDAFKASLAATAKPSSMARSYGNTGAVAGLRTVWVGELVSRAELDLDALRAHLSEDALQKAINSFVKAGGKELKGAKIYQRNDAVVR